MTRFHTSRIVSLVVLAAAAGLPAATAAAAPAAAATSYTITDLGSLGLGVSDGNAINANGQVAGGSYLSTTYTVTCPPNYPNPKKCTEHPIHAFLYGNGTMTDLGTLGGNNSTGASVNLSGQVAGGAQTKQGVDNAALWTGTRPVDLGAVAPLSAGQSSFAAAINDSGQVAGSYGTTDPQQAFSYSNGTNTLLPQPSFTGPAGCQANAINNTAQIAGECWDASGGAHLVQWRGGTVTDLGTLGTPATTTFLRALSINSTGQIAGTMFTNGGDSGFFYSNGTITSLGSFTAAAVNDNGVMVGGPSIDSGGTVQNLNTLIPAGSPYQIQNATAINNNGQIAANATDTATGQTHALLLTPA